MLTPVNATYISNNSLKIPSHLILNEILDISLNIQPFSSFWGDGEGRDRKKKTEEARKIRQKYSAYYLENLAFHDMQEIFIHSFFHSFSTMFITSSSPWIITWCLVTHGTMLRQIEALAMLILCGTISYIQFRYCLNGRWTSILEFIVYFFLIILIMNVTQEGIQVLGNKEIFFLLDYRELILS